MKYHKNYYFDSFFWSTFQKILNAIVGFLSVPLLLGAYGQADYGILGIATACNSYMHLLDMGMNAGAVKYFSQWRSEGNINLMNRVSRTNITFYGIVSFVNILGLCILAFCGESFFSVTHEEFLLLRSCLFVIAFFSIINWSATTFNQLLIANMQIAFTMKVLCVLTIFKAILIGSVLLFKLNLIGYFFLQTLILALAIIPYALKCRRMNYINSLIPAFYWKDFKIVLTFSLSIFILSLFQMTATQSRPIILGIFSNNAAHSVAEFRILEVVPQLIIMIGGTFTSLFLPKTSAMVAGGNIEQIELFAYKWTKYTTIIVNFLVMPFVLCSSEVISAYVGNEYSYLSVWLVIWCLTVLLQMHTTPGNAIILAYGKTRLLVVTTAVSCISSIILNIYLTPIYGVGGAIISYFLYVLIVIGLYYVVYYRILLKLSRLKMFKSFFQSTLLSSIILLAVYYLFSHFHGLFLYNERITYIVLFVLKTATWAVLFLSFLLILKIVTFRELKGII